MQSSNNATQVAKQPTVRIMSFQSAHPDPAKEKLLAKGLALFKCVSCSETKSIIERMDLTPGYSTYCINCYVALEV